MISATLILGLMMVSTSLTYKAPMDRGGLFPPIAKPVHIKTPLFSRTDQNYLLWTVTNSNNNVMTSSSIELARVEGSALKDSNQYEHPFKGEMWSLGVNWHRGFIYHSNYLSDKIGLISVTKSGIDASWMNGMQLLVSDIAVDYLTDNVYWIDGFAGKICVGDSLLNKYTPITDIYATHLSKMAVDPYGRRLYWTEVQPKETGKVLIRSSDLLGHDLKLVHTLNDCRDVGGLTFDHSENRLYWTENMERADKLTGAFRWIHFNRNHTRSLSPKYEVETKNMAGIISLKNYIYIIDMDRSRLLIYDKNNLRSYPRQYSVEVGELSKIPTSFEAFGPDVQPRNDTVLLEHPCYNHNCSEICISANHTSHKCICSYGKHLQADGISCNSQLLLEDNFILMSDTKHQKIVQAHADNPTFVWHTLDITPGAVYLVDYDFSSKRVIWSNSNQVISCKLDGSDRKMHLNQITVTSMAIDHTSRNLYFANGNSIGVLSLDSNRTNFFKIFPSEKVYHIRNIVVCSKLGKVFWAGSSNNAHFNANQATIENTAFVESMNLDGSGLRVIASLKSIPCGLTIKEDDRTLYWMDCKKKKISWLDVNGNVSSTKLNHSNIAVKESSTHVLNNPVDLSYYDGYLYIVGVGHSVFYRVKVADIHNEEAGYPEQFGPKMMYSATFIRFLNSANYKTSADDGHECAVNKGNCSQICLPTRNQNKTQAQCACTYDSEMISGNCVKRNTTTVEPKFVDCRPLQLLYLGPCQDHKNHTLPTAYDSKGQRLTVKSQPTSTDKLVQGVHWFYSTAIDRDNNSVACSQLVVVIGYPCKDLPKPQNSKMVSNGTCGNKYGSKRTITCKDGVSFSVTCTKNQKWIADEQEFCPKVESTHEENTVVAVSPTHGPRSMGGTVDKKGNDKPKSTIGRNVLISFGIILMLVLLVGLGLYIKRNCGHLYLGPFGMRYSRGDDGVQLTKEDYSNAAFEERESPPSNRQNSVYTFPNC